MTRPLAGRVVHLLPLDLETEELWLLSWLGSALAQRTGILPVEDSPLPIHASWIDAASGQCASNRVVDALIERAGGLPRDEWTLAVTGADLVADGRDFVFGEAALGGAWALVSFARLRPPGDDDDRLRARLLTEALHELGHLAGLGHCDHPRCAMRRAALPEEIDRKDASLCPECRAALEGNT